ncbi:MAG: DMT family transporter [Candidatus Bathyarchaeia archaeon]
MAVGARGRGTKGLGDRGYLRALLEGLLVTFLWSTSYVLIKMGLRELPPLTFAAYRYIIASMVLLAVTLLRDRGIPFSAKEDLPKLFLLGLSGYSVAQGLQYVGLSHLPAVTVTFLLNFTPVTVLLFGIVFLREYPAPLQLAGMTLALLGAYLFFLAPLSGAELIGVTVTLLSGSGWAAYMVSSRQFLKRERFKTLHLTALTMFFGAITLLISALLIEGPVGISLCEWAIILWLSLVNTALAFVLWNHALERMRAFELSILQNTMLIQIGILAWTFLGEGLKATKIVAMAMVFLGVLIVQIVKPKPR